MIHANFFESIGGSETCRSLSAAFYARVARDPILRPLFPGKTLHCAIEEFAAFLIQFFGGPAADTQRRWWLSLRESHARFEISHAQRDAWIQNMEQALREVPLEESTRARLLRFFEHSSTYLLGETDTGQGDFHWPAQRLLDDTIDAIRGDDAERALTLASTEPLRTYLDQRPALFAQLLARMIASGNAELREHVVSCLQADPARAHERFNGRTLLHAASAAGDLGIAELLLQLGADPNGLDEGGHAPLYSVANECGFASGAAVVRALVQSGARVNANQGVKQCTALHMAARRGHVEIAETLLACGAALEARDSAGDTPLRRAVNCGKAGVARFLLKAGADRHSIGSKGLTPTQAARTASLKELFQRI